MNKIQRSLRNLNRILADDYENLSDKCKNLELSHNRMKKLLQMTLVFLEGPSFYAEVTDINQNLLLSEYVKDAEYLHKRITLELYGLENYKGVKK